MLDMKQFDEVRKAYNERDLDSFSALLLGESGSGKTHMLKTLPGTTLIHSFDPRGTDTIRREIQEGDKIVSDVRWEHSSPSKPIASKWEREFNRLIRTNVFKDVDNYVIDSYTFFSEAWIDQIAMDNNRPKNLLQIKDWMRLGNIIKEVLKMGCNLPCRFILTAHIVPREDINTITYTIFANPKLQLYIPALFSEVYCLRAITRGTQVKRELLTSTFQNYIAKTRMGGYGIFDLKEEPDFKVLLNKLKSVKPKGENNG